MPNILTGNPHVIDTPGAAMIFVDQLRVKSVRWVGGTSAGHVAEIQDENSNVLWRSVANAANEDKQSLIENLFWKGYKVTILQSGKLYITYA